MADKPTGNRRTRRLQLQKTKKPSVWKRLLSSNLFKSLKPTIGYLNSISGVFKVGQTLCRFMPTLASKISESIDCVAKVIYDTSAHFIFALIIAMLLPVIPVLIGIMTIIRGVLIVISLWIVIIAVLRVHWLKNVNAFLRLVILLGIVVSLFLLSWYEVPNRIERHYRPEVQINIFPSPEMYYKYPLFQYRGMIQNLNLESAPISDLSVEFHFENRVTIAEKYPLVNPLGEGYEEYNETNGRESRYKDQPIETAITRNCSLEIRKAEINDQTVNTSAINFSCDKWPERLPFGLNVVVNQQAGSDEHPTNANRDGTYEGGFTYKIMGESFSQKIYGPILDDRLMKTINQLNPREGTFGFWSTRDNRWFGKNGFFVDILPVIMRNQFTLHIYRDSDNIFKVLISNNPRDKVVLKYSDFDKLKRPTMIAVTWTATGSYKLYLNGVLVDKYPGFVRSLFTSIFRGIEDMYNTITGYI